MSYQTPLARVRGLGTSKNGVSHWWSQRITAVALVPLSLWFVISLVSLVGAEHAAVVNWIKSPIVIVFLVLFIAAMLHHAQLGLQVVIEDYVHTEWAKLFILILVKFATLILALTAIFQLLKISFGG